MENLLNDKQSSEKQTWEKPQITALDITHTHGENELNLILDPELMLS